MNVELLLIVIILVFIFSDSKNNKEKYTNSKKIKKIEKFTLNSKDFDVYVIHMAKNTDRLVNFNNHYNRSDLIKRYNIFPAVVGKNLNLIDFVSPQAYTQIIETEKTGKRKHHYDLTKGAVGCYLSHLSIYKKIIESNVDYGLIFEDDSKIVRRFYSKMLEGLDNLPDDWDIFLLGVICLKCEFGKKIVKVDRFWGTHGYLIKNKSAAKLLEYLDKPLSKQIDADMSLLVKRGLLNVYAINPVIVTQDSKFGSDIQSNVIDSSEAFNEEFNQQKLFKSLRVP